MSDNRLKFAAIVLAAGQSTRMGTDNKLLTQLNNKMLIQHILTHIEQSVVSEIIVVTGHDAGKVTQAIEPFNVKSVMNNQYQTGLSSSINIALPQINPGIDGILICHGDMPFVTGSIINQIVQVFVLQKKIIIPTFHGQAGNPWLWPMSKLDKLKNLSGDRGAKQLMSEIKKDVCFHEIDNVGILLDIDDVTTLNLYQSKFNHDGVLKDEN